MSTNGVCWLALPAGFDVKDLLIISALLTLLVDRILTLPKSFTSTTATLTFSFFAALIQKVLVSLGPKTILLS